MPTPAEQLARLTSMLGLSADQQKSILVILQDQQKGMKDIFTNDSLDRDQRRQAMKDLRTATREKIRALLTPEQVAKFKEDMHGWKTHEGSSSN